MTDELVTRLRNRTRAAVLKEQDRTEAAARIEQDAATIARLEEELRISRQSERHSADWATAAIDDMKAAEAKLAQAVEVLRGLCDEWGKSDPGTLFRAHNAARAFLDSMGCK